MCAYAYSSIKNVFLNLKWVIVVNDNSIAYFEVKLVMKKNILTINVDV